MSQDSFFYHLHYIGNFLFLFCFFIFFVFIPFYLKPLSSLLRLAMGIGVLGRGFQDTLLAPCFSSPGIPNQFTFLFTPFRVLGCLLHYFQGLHLYWAERNRERLIHAVLFSLEIILNHFKYFEPIFEKFQSVFNFIMGYVYMHSL